MRNLLGRSFLAILALLVIAMPSLGQQGIPTTESILGKAVGSDFYLASYDESLQYFQALDAASDKLELIKIGQTSMGLDWYIAIISSPENLANLDRYREIAMRLAHPEGLTDSEARQLAVEGKAIAHVDGGLHSTEVAGHQHTPLLAYTLLTGDDNPEIQAILDNVITMLWFSLNPDGQNMISEWYNSNLGTPFEMSRTPELYQKYIGHDNNRDGYMINQIESRVVTRVVRDWEPQLLYNHHQTSPFPTRIWIPPFAEPISPHVHPLMWRTVNLMGMSMAQALEERNQPGAMHMGTGFDDWYPGFLDHAHSFHNVASFLTETAGVGYATPRFYSVRDFPAPRNQLRPESLYASPWQGGWWRLRDAVEYCHTASMSVLDFAAKYKYDVLYNRYQAGRDVIDQFTQDPPYAYFIPQDQRDPVAAVEMLRRLAFNGIEVHQLTTEATHEGVTYPAGTWVIPMDQPFANFTLQLFDVQEYPEILGPGGEIDTPYDVSGWTLPYQMDVRVIEAATPLTDAVRGTMQKLEGGAVAWDADPGEGAEFDSVPGVGFDSNPLAAAIVPPAGSATGSGSALIVDAAQNNSFRAVQQAWKSGGTVQFRPGTVGADGEPGASGKYVISGLNANTIAQMVSGLALQAERGTASGTRISRPRVALYRPWGGNIDEGWTRWLLEIYGFEPITIRNFDVAAGDLDSRFDVIIFADYGANTILEGNRKGTVRPRYAGGIGKMGVRHLEDFVSGGGTLVCINNSSMFAIEQFNLPVENAIAGVSRGDYFLGGAILEMVVDPSHPVMTGMPERAKVVVGRGPVFTTKEGFEGTVLAKYAEHGSPLLSGFLRGEEYLQGYASALDVELGDGHVILLAARPQWRGQPFGNFRMLFNAALFHGDVAANAAGTPGFWTAPEPREEEEGEEQDSEQPRRRPGTGGPGGMRPGGSH